jgi:hypothetical protein
VTSAHGGGASRRSGTAVERHTRIARIGLVDDSDLDPALAALELATLDHPDLSPNRYHATLAEIGDAFCAADVQSTTLCARASALAIIIGGHFGLLGEHGGPEPGADTDMVRVLDRRRGPPVNMAIIYTSVARRAGLRVMPFAFGRRVLCGLHDGQANVVIDPFSAGAIVQHKGTIGWENVRVLSNRGLLARLLIDDAIRCEAAGDRLHAARLFERLTVAVPENVDGWFGLVRFKLLLDHQPEVRADLVALLEVTRDPGLRIAALAALAA